MQEFSTVVEWSHALTQKKISAVEAVDFYAARIQKCDGEMNAYITTSFDDAYIQAQKIDAERAAPGAKMSPLAGIPFGVKDAIDTAGIRSTGAAKILDTYTPSFDSTIVARVRDAGGIIIGKHNCDAFGHGASNENSMYGPVKNPWDTSRVSGGSSGGSAASVAADTCAFSIAEDTGGSIRYPAGLCGITGLKVSYGRNSRYGAMPMASSLDTVGPIARTAEDIALIMEHIAGYDPRDATTSDAPVPQYTKEIKKTIRGKKIGVPQQFFVDSLDDEIRSTIETALDELRSAGAEIVSISLPHTEYAIATYYVLVPCEDSSNLARLDGMRYGVRADAPDLFHTYTHSRAQGFPPEVKRRIMIGTFALSHGYYDAYYVQAQKARTHIKNDFEEAFKKVDVIVAPTSPEVAFKLGEKTNDPMKMYLADIFVGSASLAGVCSLSVPCGFVKGLPVGMQFIGPRLREEVPLMFGHQFQQITNWHTQHPLI